MSLFASSPYLRAIVDHCSDKTGGNGASRHKPSVLSIPSVQVLGSLSFPQGHKAEGNKHHRVVAILAFHSSSGGARSCSILLLKLLLKLLFFLSQCQTVWTDASVSGSCAESS